MNRRIKFALIVSLFGFSTNVLSQYSFEYNDSIEVIKSNDTLINAWGGGLNFAQFSDFDYDFDGDLDLFVFDRSHDNIRVFTQEDNGGKHYKLAYNAKANFPPNLIHRATLVDYDNDGRKDLFTYTTGGLMVYRNVGDIVNGLQWELFQSSIYTDYVLGNSTLIIGSSDIPAIIDVDNDGDIDILTFDQSGKHIEYHQNQSMELYGIPDSLIYVQKNECWGKFAEDGITNLINLNDLNAPCVGGNIPNPEKDGALSNLKLHAGSSILALDYNNSGLLDLVLGDATFGNLVLLTNGGTVVNSDSPMIAVDYAFPSNTTPVDINLFPAAFYLDVDFDGIKDLIACPNAQNVSFDEKSVFFYKNIGTNANPTFIFADEDFLQDEMIEHGTGSIPVFFDVNEDGLEDLIVANFYHYKPVSDKESTIAYYQNIGTQNNPVLQYIDNDFLNLSQENYGLKSVPAFGDIDNDGDKDLFIGVQNGTLVYYENLSIGAGAIWAPPVVNYPDNLGATISTLSFNHPYVFDLNSDGLQDLIIGTRLGKIVYYENIGTLTNPSFELKNSELGNVDVSTFTPDGYASPHFFVDSGEVVLFTGNIDGDIYYYNDISNNLDSGQSFNLVSSSLLDINVEAYSSVWVNDLDLDSNLNLFVGQDLGGLFHFEVVPGSTIGMGELSPNYDFKMYPNPTNDYITIEFSQLSAKYSIMDMKGNLMAEGEFNSQQEQIDVTEFSSGLYFVSVQLLNGRIITKKLIKR